MNLWNVLGLSPVLLSLLCVCAAQAESANSIVPPTYLNGLRRIESIASPIELKVTRSRKSELPLTDLSRLLGYSQPDPTFLKPVKVSVAHDRGRIFSRVEQAVASRDKGGAVTGIAVGVTRFAFDGHVVYNWSGDGRPAEQSTLFRDTKESLLSDSHPEAELFRTRILQMLGIGLPNTVGELGMSGGSYVLHLIEGAQQASATVTGDGLRVDCELPDGTIWSVQVDPQLGYLNSEFEIQPPSSNWVVRRLTGTVLDAGRKSNGGQTVIPALVRVRYIDDSGRVLYREDYDISKASNAPIPDERFVLTDLRPGVAVADGSLAEAEGDASGRVEYSVPASQRDLERTVEAARQDFSAQLDAGGVNGWRILAFAAPVVAVVGVLLLLRRRRALAS